VPIHLPPLRERPEDVLALSKTFLSEYARKFSRHFKGIDPEARDRLLAYRWPGNVRELRHVIERICIMHDADTLQPEHLPKELYDTTNGSCQAANVFDVSIPHEGVNLDDLVDQFTSHIIRKALQMADGNISQAAKMLGIPRGTLRYRLEKCQSDSAVIPALSQARKG